MERQEKIDRIWYALCEDLPKKLLCMMEGNKRGMYFLLRYLEKASGPVTCKEISEALHFTTPRVAAALKALENKTYVTRSLSHEDGRKTLVAITDTGRAELARRDGELRMLLNQLVEYLGDEDFLQFCRIQKRINAFFEEQGGICSPADGRTEETDRKNQCSGKRSPDVR